MVWKASLAAATFALPVSTAACAGGALDQAFSGDGKLMIDLLASYDSAVALA